MMKIISVDFSIKVVDYSIEAFHLPGAPSSILKHATECDVSRISTFLQGLEGELPIVYKLRLSLSLSRFA